MSIIDYNSSSYGTGGASSIRSSSSNDNNKFQTSNLKATYVSDRW